MVLGMINFLQKHFPESSFNGRLHLGSRTYSRPAVMPISTFDYDSIYSVIRSFSFFDNSDYYITANAVHGVRRLQDDLFSLHNIVIDIDCHGDILSSERDLLINSLIFRLNHDVFGNELEVPTSIVFTGRGLQLWWAIEGISFRFKQFYRELVSNYCQILTDFLEMSVFDDLSLFSVDAVASKNLVGFYRLPETYNTKTGAKVKYTSCETSYTLMGLFEKQKTCNSSISSAIISEKHIPKQASFTIESFTDLSEKRIHALYMLRDLRNSDIGNEERNNFCFMVYNTLVPIYGHRISFSQMRVFNDGFKKPMSENELNCVISTSKKKNGYHYSNSKFIDFLGISDLEAQDIGLYYTKDVSYVSKKNKVRLSAKMTKNERDLDVLEMFKSGKNISAISRDMGISQPTVSKILKSNNAGTPKVDKEQVQNLLIAGFSLVDIASKYNCSTKTIQRIKNQIFM